MAEIHTEIIDRLSVDIAKERGGHRFDAMIARALDKKLETRFRYILPNGDEGDASICCSESRWESAKERQAFLSTTNTVRYYHF